MQNKKEDNCSPKTLLWFQIITKSQTPAFLFKAPKASPASRTLMMAGVCSMSMDTLSNQPFSNRNIKTFRRLWRPLRASAFSRLASSGWYLDLNLCPELGSTKVWGGNDGGLGWTGCKSYKRKKKQKLHIQATLFEVITLHWICWLI